MAEEENMPISREESKKMLKEIKVDANLINPKIYPATKYVEPRVCIMKLTATEDDGKSVDGCKIRYETRIGVIDVHSNLMTDINGFASAYYYSFKTGEDVIKIRFEKEGYKPAEVELSVEVVETATPLKIVNHPRMGAIFLNGEKIGEGLAELLIAKKGIYTVDWGALEGYEPPERVRLYINPDFSVEPITIEGKYIPKDENRDYVDLTVFVCITLDESSGIPNPVPNAWVSLSDGQTGITDNAGLIKFRVKADYGPLKVKAKHPNLFECYRDAEVIVGRKDIHVNLDFGIFFGGEAVVGLEI